MQRKPNPRSLAAAFLLASAALSIAVLALRNLYDDELSSLDLVIGPVRNILHYTSVANVHPPGMYLLAHVAYLVLPSFRWVNLFPAAFLYAGLSFFLLQVTPLFARTRSQICLLLLATLHPELLMCGASFRWYGWWTGLALVALTIALQPREPTPSLSSARAITLGLLLASLYYLNYITFLFAIALIAAMLLRYRTQPLRRLLPRALLACAVSFVLIAPQLHTMFAVHLQQSSAQRDGVATSSLRLLQAVAASEAYLPWHPLAILACIVFAALSIAGATALLQRRRHRAVDHENLQAHTALAAITVFAVLFFLLTAVSGLGGKPRNGLLLIPVLAPALAWAVGTIRRRLQDAALIFLVLWSAVGIAHLLGRYGLAKASMNDHPEQVVSFVRQTTGDDCSVVVTTDGGLAFSLAQSKLPRLLIVSTYQESVFGGASSLPVDNCAHTILYSVQSYAGGDSEWQRTLGAELRSSTQFFTGPPQMRSFSLDPDASRKRSLARMPLLGADLADAARLPDYRYIVTFAPIRRADVEAMRQRMPDFISGAGVNLDPPPPRPADEYQVR
jgi:hypothetical protein